MTDLSVISIKFTEATLDAIVQECGGIRHTSWSFGDGFKKGDSYLSEAFRLIVQGVAENGYNSYRIKHIRDVSDNFVVI